MTQTMATTIVMGMTPNLARVMEQSSLRSGDRQLEGKDDDQDAQQDPDQRRNRRGVQAE